MIQYTIKEVPRLCPNAHGEEYTLTLSEALPDPAAILALYGMTREDFVTQFHCRPGFVCVKIEPLTIAGLHAVGGNVREIVSA